MLVMADIPWLCCALLIHSVHLCLLFGNTCCAFLCYSWRMADEQFLTVKEVAERLRVNPYTVRRWLRTGQLRGRLMGGDRGGYRIAASELGRFMREGPAQGRAHARAEPPGRAAGT